MATSARRRQRVSLESKERLKETTDDQVSMADTASIGESVRDDDCVTCDACPHCDDRCNEPNCFSCRGVCRIVGEQKFSWSPCCTGEHVGSFTQCQVRRHNNEESAWIVAGDTVYDATPILHRHPGGIESILRKAGGVLDCTQDIEFHSKGSSKLFKKLVIGKLCPCPGEVPASDNQKQWWMFW